MSPILYAVLGIALVAVIYFVFLRKKDDADSEALQKKPAEPRLAAKKPEAAKASEPARTAAKEVAKEATRPAKETSKPDVAAASKGEPQAAAAEAEDEDEDVDVAEEDPKARAQAPLSKRARDVKGLRKGLAKARDNEGFFGRLKAIFGGKKEIDPELVEQIEEVLLTSDVGVLTTERLMSSIRESLEKGELKNEAKVWEALRREALTLCDRGPGGLQFADTPTVVLVVGVNGSGKTTTIGKLATRLSSQGKKVVLAAGDTFRAAAVEQLTVWGKRAGCEVVTGTDGSNSGAVIFDAIQKAKEIGADVVLADTAGRLHTKSNLMDELKKIQKTLSKAQAGAPHETLLVLDSTNGQNASQQAAMFKEAIGLSGLVLTKLDGTAKGGVVLGICAEHDLPIRFVGIGERPEDLRDFNAEEFVEALLGAGAEPGADQAA